MITLSASTIVRDAVGRAHVFAAGAEVPGWAVPLITADILLDDGSPDAVEVVAGVPVETVAEERIKGIAESIAETAVAGAEAVSKPAAKKIPPVKGKGSGAAAWAEYAKANGFEVEEDAKASEIREALAEVGVPVE